MQADKKRITLCADDFALSEGVSQGIVSLLHNERLSATSCMTTESRWQHDASLLLPLRNKVDIGLHFNLTEGNALTLNPFDSKNKQFSSLGAVMRGALLHQVKPEPIKQELVAQLDAFVDVMGQLPDFIDGHQHVHHLPVIRHVLLDVYQQRFQGHQCYIRAVAPLVLQNTACSIKQRIKQWTILQTGGKATRLLLHRREVPCNTMFAGIYDFSDVRRFPCMMHDWLQSAVDGTLIMCHPGMSSAEEDVLSDSRHQEYRYLQSDEFMQLCERYNIGISRFSFQN